MKKALLGVGLFLALIYQGVATETTLIQGQGVVYGHTDTVYGYPTWGQAGEITPVHNMLLYGYISASFGGFANISIDVDTDYPAGYYYAGDLPNGDGELYINLF